MLHALEWFNIILMILTIVLFIYQHLLPRGTTAHIVRGHVIPILGIIIIALNIQFTPPSLHVEMSSAFVWHRALGAIYFLILFFFVLPTGWILKINRCQDAGHKFFVSTSEILLILSLLAGLFFHVGY